MRLIWEVTSKCRLKKAKNYLIFYYIKTYHLHIVASILEICFLLDPTTLLNAYFQWLAKVWDQTASLYVYTKIGEVEKQERPEKEAELSWLKMLCERYFYICLEGVISRCTFRWAIFCFVVNVSYLQNVNWAKCICWIVLVDYCEIMSYLQNVSGAKYFQIINLYGNNTSLCKICLKNRKIFYLRI